MDDLLFRMTRERAVVLLTDVDRGRALEIMERLLSEFRERFPSATGPAVAIGYYEVAPGGVPASAKRVLPRIFASSPQSH
jgi:GGDEF domain-containing protein